MRRFEPNFTSTRNLSHRHRVKSRYLRGALPNINYAPKAQKSSLRDSLDFAESRGYSGRKLLRKAARFAGLEFAEFCVRVGQEGLLVICAECRGFGWLWQPPGEAPKAPSAENWSEAMKTSPHMPCPSCGGSGIASCCEGAVGLAGDVTNG